MRVINSEVHIGRKGLRNIVSLEGCPKLVKGDFIIYDNEVKFTEDQIRSVCDVRGTVVFY